MASDRPLVIALIVLLAAAALVHRRRPALARGALWLAVAALTAMLIVRWVVSGHPPIFGTFETDLAETWLLLLLTPLIARRLGEPYLRGPVLVALLTLAHTFLLRHEITPLTISEVSLWIDLHAPLAWLAWAGYFHATCLAFRSIAAGDLALRALGLGFCAHSAMGFVGVYYATVLFASPWSWDPVQSLGLLSWVLFAIALHLRLFYNLSLHRQRYFLLVLVTIFVLSAKLIMFFPAGQSFHVFELGQMATLKR